MRETSARRLACVATTALLATLFTTGCSQDEAAAPTPTPTPLDSLNTTAMQIPRIEFCKLVPGSAVKGALGGEPDSSASYSNGDDVAVPDVGKEVVHETGCSWSTDAGATARAWVFARPVDGAFARRAVASSRETPGCRVVRGPSYGDPSVTQTCRQGGSARVRHAGLFGQTWLSCEVSDPTAGVPAVRPRADTWCVEVVNALDTSG
jgi:hypothetical protein